MMKTATKQKQQFALGECGKVRNRGQKYISIHVQM